MFSNNHNNSSSRRPLPTLGSSNSSSVVVDARRVCLQSNFWRCLRNVGFIIVIVFVWTRTGSLQDDVNSQHNNNNNHQQHSLPTTRHMRNGSLQEEHSNNQSQHHPLTTTMTTTTIPNPPQKKLSLRLLGERHSGTTWMSGHLEDCFGQSVHVFPRFASWKHWFQNEQNAPPDDVSVVVAQFRNVYHWIEAMRIDPYHSPQHYDLDWREFVTKSWTMPRYGQDVIFEGINSTYNAGGGNSTQQCMTNPAFKPYQVIPCNADGILYKDWNGSRTTRNVTVLYELRDDGSGTPFDNILELRSAKIRNFLAVADYKRVYGFFPVQYEVMAEGGTAPLIHKLEEALNVSARCVPIPGTPIAKRPLSMVYVTYMRQHVDWETEALIGYYPGMV